MKNLFISTLLLVLLNSCHKEISASEYAKSLLIGKTWFLDYTIQNNQTKSFIGKSTYFIQFTNNDQTTDSDGIVGSFQIEENNKQLSLLINAKTQNGSSANYTYLIEQIGSDNLMVSYMLGDNTIKKLFSTTH